MLPQNDSEIQNVDFMVRCVQDIADRHVLCVELDEKVGIAIYWMERFDQSPLL